MISEEDDVKEMVLTLTLTAPGGAGGGIKGPVGGGVLRARDVVEKDTRSWKMLLTL